MSTFAEQRATDLDRRDPLALILYQTGMLVLGVILLGLARQYTVAPEIRAVLPVLNSLIIFWCCVQLVSVVLTGKGRQAIVPMQLRLAVDMVFCLWIVWLTGGVLSFFLPILFASVLAVTTLVGLNRALLLASTATIALSVMTVGEILGYRPTDWSGTAQIAADGRVPFLLAALAGQGVALHAIAFLGSRLMGGLERVESLNDRIVRSMCDGLIALDERGRLTLMNTRAESMLGRAPGSEWRGSTPREFFRRESDRELVELLDHPEPGTRVVEWRISRQRVAPMSIACSSIETRRGARKMWVFVFRDLAPERRAAAAEARVRKLQALEDLSLGLVHEIRNPLASIRGCAQELGRQYGGDGQGERLTSIIVRESDRLDRIVNEFLECSSTSPTFFSPIDVDALLAEVIDSLKQRADARAMTIRCSGSAATTIEGQRELLYRVFFNLGVNAIEASSDGDEYGEIDYRISAVDGGIQVEVRDHGCGMDEATRRRVFNPFFTTKAREGGLGLALVERIVHGHGGAIDVDSRVGHGARFRIWLPARVVDASEGSAVESATSKPDDECDDPALQPVSAWTTAADGVAAREGEF